MQFHPDDNISAAYNNILTSEGTLHFTQANFSDRDTVIGLYFIKANKKAIV